MKRTIWGAVALAGLAGTATLAALPSSASDHLDAPLVQQDGRTDINDLYVFASPDNPDNTVFVLTVNPGAGVISGTTLDPDAIYKIRIDTNGDSKTDKRIQFKFGAVAADGTQSVRFSDNVVQGKGTTGGSEFGLTNGGKATVGTFDDPFFFDLQAFNDSVKGAGGSRTFCDANATDFFAGLDTTAVVVEVPTKSISADSTNFAVWAETRTASADRIDRVGRPGIATVLIKDTDKNKFNKSNPRVDQRVFGNQVRDRLIALSGGGYNQAEAQGLVEVLLPDLLTVDVSQPSAYLNGRALGDDVIDASLGLVTNGALTSDCVDSNDVAFSNSFPYLAPAHSDAG